MEKARIREFPHQFLLTVEGASHIIGRVIVDKIGDCYHSEIALVQSENQKIIHHVGNIYHIDDYDELFKLSVQKLAGFLQQQN